MRVILKEEYLAIPDDGKSNKAKEPQNVHF